MMNPAFIQDIIFVPYLPAYAVGAFILAALILIILHIWQNQRAWSFRLIVFIIFSLLLLNPSIREQQTQPLPMTVYAFIDQSPSQNLKNRTEQSQEALFWIQQQLDKHNDQLKLETLAIGEDNLSETLLFDTINDTLRNVPTKEIAGVFLITDGQIHDISTATHLNKDIPFHALITGRDDEKDQKIIIKTAPLYGIIGQSVTASVQVDIEGYTQKNGTIDMRYNDETITMPFISGEPFSVTLPIDKPGQNVFVFERVALPDELTTLNNKTAVIVKGIRDRLKVMLISGHPHQGGRMWRDTLKSDPSVDMVHFTILRDLNKVDPTPQDELALIPFPVRELFEVKINEFDLIIFDQYDQIELLPPYYFDNIRNFVESGGGFLAAEGPSFAGRNSIYNTSLADLLPAKPDFTETQRAFTPTLSDLGKYHPVTQPLSLMDNQAFGQWYRQLNSLESKGDILMKGADEQPLLILDRFGRGRVAQLMSDQLWLWSRGWGENSPYLPLIRNTLHWLMKEPDLEDRGLFVSAAERQINVDLRDTTQEITDPSINITDPNGRSFTLSLETRSPHQATTTFTADSLGLYKIEHQDTIRYIVIGSPNPKEYTDMRSKMSSVEILTDAHNSKTARIHNALNMNIETTTQNNRYATARRFYLKQGENYRVISSTQKSLIPLPYILGIFLLSLGLCWWKESGLSATFFKKRQ